MHGGVGCQTLQLESASTDHLHAAKAVDWIQASFRWARDRPSVPTRHQGHPSTAEALDL
jgi:hypothetical protein